MTSKYQYKTQIDRRIKITELQKILSDLENGVILEFNTVAPEDGIPTPILLKMSACGCIDYESYIKTVKLTNDQRRQLIRLGREALASFDRNKSNKFFVDRNKINIIIFSNEYIDSLPIL